MRSFALANNFRVKPVPFSRGACDELGHVHVDAGEAVGESQFDNFALVPRHAQRGGVKVFEHEVLHKIHEPPT